MIMKYLTKEEWSRINKPVYTVASQRGDSYSFTREEDARWFQRCRTIVDMKLGSTPRDDGNLFMTEEERDEVLKKEPQLERFIHQCYGSKEFIQNIKRYCFWLVDASPTDIKKSRILYERVQKVKEFRLQSTREKTQELSETPHLFAEIRQPATNYLLIPRVSSERRQYIPMGYMSPDVIVTDAAFSLQQATPFHFGVLTSRVHMGWMRQVCGRLRSDYRYSNTIVYNTFIWPLPNPLQVMDVESAANKILNVRKKYPDASFADLYDEVTMPKDLRDAHRENDAAVMRAYGLPEDMSEEDVVMHMFKLYYAAKGMKWPVEE